MIKLLGHVPKRVFLACSGGSDSMTALAFLMAGRRDVHILHVDHGTPHAAEARRFVIAYANAHAIPYISMTMPPSPRGVSAEAFWHDARKRFFLRHGSVDRPVVLAHHAHDAAEQWIMTSLRGRPEVIPYASGGHDRRIIRPFLATLKDDMMAYASRHHVTWIDDPSNNDLRHPRNRVRHEMLKHATACYPGFLRMITNRVRETHAAIMAKTDH
jgi:tRNA(Ile)-lysidine synthase